MKTPSYKLFAVAFAFIVFSFSTFAQSNSVQFEVPFNFHVGNERLTAGTYQIKRINTNSFLIRNESGSVKVLAQTPLTLENAKASLEETLVFNRYGNKYFLRQIFAIRNNVGRALYESKTERSTRQGIQDNEELAKNAKPEQIAVKLKTN
jgi:hypothetical protein